MKKTFDFKPKHLKKLSLKVEKLLEKKEGANSIVFKRIKKVFKF